MLSFLRQEMKLRHLEYQAEAPQVDDCIKHQWHKALPACGVVNEHDDIETCSDACSGAQSTAKYPLRTLQLILEKSEREMMVAMTSQLDPPLMSSKIAKAQRWPERAAAEERL